MESRDLLRFGTELDLSLRFLQDESHAVSSGPKTSGSADCEFDLRYLSWSRIAIRAKNILSTVSWLEKSEGERNLSGTLIEADPRNHMRQNPLEKPSYGADTSFTTYVGKLIELVW